MRARGSGRKVYSRKGLGGTLRGRESEVTMRVRLRFALLLVLALPSAARPATRVDLILDEVEPRTIAWPVTTGVPFPRDRLRSADRCRLVDDLGAEQPLQARAAATWDGPGGSVRWLTIDF